MAKPSWLITNPELSGSGNGTIQNSASEHTGRVAREGTVTVTAAGLETPKTYKVTQTPKAEFASFNDGTEMAAAKEGSAALKIKGKSNSAKLTFAFVGEAKEATIAENYLAHGVSTVNGAAIEGDPGATAQYEFEVTINVPANETVEEISRTLSVTTDGGEATQIVIKQTAGDPTLEITPVEIIIPQAGTPAVDVEVTSNTTWTIS